jgi:peptidoglycan/LPS O-acetylase OafA/YrhL
MRAATSIAAYRKDVDGLRALAILPVLLYHAGVTAFSGGFVGVDVFFVISGFLITGVIARDIARERFSIATFYVRRAKRILPALITVLITTFVIGLVLLEPSELRELAGSTAITALSGSNVLFWTQTVGYFAGRAELKPLLMTWSLGVEEQFYFFWPLALSLTLRWRGSVAWMVAIVAAISFGISWFGVYHYPTATFYLLPPRAWELLAGAALALVPVKESGRTLGTK